CLRAVSSRFHCSPDSRSTDTGPLERSASVPPSRHLRRHWRTVPDVTLNSAATAPALSPRSNNRAASSLSCSRLPCSAVVSPPLCAYLMIPTYRRDQGTSRPHNVYEFNLSSTPAVHRDLHVWDAACRR